MHTATLADYEIRRADTRGTMKTSWLDAKFSFSFGPYRHPERMNFDALIALNEDIIQPGTGFGMHPHQDLEIFILPLSGQVEHRDSLGNHAIVKPDQVQKMTAGRGISHSQMNASQTALDHHLQIWIAPRTKGLTPGIEQRSFDPQGQRGKWQLLVSPDARGKSLSVNADAHIFRRQLDEREVYRHAGSAERSLYLYVVSGTAIFTSMPDGAEQTLSSGDSVAMKRAGDFELGGGAAGAQLLMFDLPPVDESL